MAAEEIEYDGAVGYLVFYRADKPDMFVDLPIASNEQLDIGRQEVTRALGLTEPAISTHHLRFHCVMYGDDEAEKVPPLVYVRLLSSNAALLTHNNSAGGTSTYLLEKDHPDVLLNHGDTLKLTSQVVVKYSALYEDARPQLELDAVRQLETKQFANQYTVTPRKLGSGGYASVYLAINRKTRRQVACKIVPLPEKPPLPNTPGYQAFQQRVKIAGRNAAEQAASHRKKLEELRREFEILKNLDHPNIVRLEKAIYSTDHVYIFQELITGGDLLSYLEKKRGLEQPEAAVIIFQLLKAVDYLHDNGIVHRDIKPENVLMTSWRMGDRVVLTDFGQSRLLANGDNAAKEASIFRMQSVIGTLGYTAPEVHKQMHRNTHPRQGYSKAIDMWSIGCLTGTLFTNQFLFLRDATTGTYAPPSTGSQDTANDFDLGFLDTREEWKAISGKAKSFIRSCVVVDETQRLTAKQALQHHFLNHPGYAKHFQAAYGRAIADWKPRAKKQDMIEYIRPDAATVQAAKAGYGALLHEEVKYKHFPAGVPSVPQFRAFETFAQATKQRHTPLSPLTSELETSEPPAKVQRTGSKRRASRITDNIGGKMKVGKRRAEDESVFSIQDFAPPDTQWSMGTGAAQSDRAVMDSMKGQETFEISGYPTNQHRKSRLW